jgi:hypothetical protein
VTVTLQTLQNRFAICEHSPSPFLTRIFDTAQGGLPQEAGQECGIYLLFHNLHLLFVHTTAMNLELGQSTVNLFQVFRG